MTRPQLEHILRAAGAITGADRFIVIDSQAVLGSFPDAPRELLMSVEADVLSPRSSEDTDLVEGSIGELSPFHRTFGYYAHGVGADTATLPKGWQDRLVKLNTPATGNVTGLCLDVHDLAVSKLVAGREKDASFVNTLVRERLADPDTIAARLADTALEPSVRARCLQALGR